MDIDRLSGHDTRRRRNALACNTCRGRRTKCDGQRPKCSFCAERGKDCFYQEPQDLPPSPLKAELLRVWEQLDHITAAVGGQTPQGSPLTDGQHGYASKTARDVSAGFPFMTVQSEAFMSLLGLDQSLSQRFEHIERGRQTFSAQPYGTGVVMIDLLDALSLLSMFTGQINTWYPILHAAFLDEFIEAVTSCFPPTVSSCITLLVLAIGSAVESESINDTLRNHLDKKYIQAAMEMLPCVFAESCPRGAQCLLLFAIYHLCRAQPCQAHDFVAMASYKLQNYIMSELATDDDTSSILGNCFWSALLIESELRVQLDLVDSGIWDMTPFAPAPTISSTWPLNQPPSSLAPRTSGSETYARSTDLSYFVAEIAVRKMLQRCTWSTSTVAQGRHVYAPIVAAELERQLEVWLQLLPESLSFSRPACVGSGPSRKPSPAQVEFLRAQYYAFKASIYWPAVYETLTAGEANGDLLQHCRRFFSSYAEFVPSAVAAVAVCKPNLWTLCTSVFTISMAALTALREPSLLEVAPQGVDQGLELASKVLDGVMEVSPSLAQMGGILRERLNLYNSSWAQS
ncbi:hypothetical protein BDV10DRAFT_200154 [Aspergillus recurvatus]